MTTQLELDEFARAYVECALWSTNDEATPSGGEPLDGNYGIEDIDPGTLAAMIDDCRRFQEENAGDLARYDHPQWTAGTRRPRLLVDAEWARGRLLGPNRLPSQGRRAAPHSRRERVRRSVPVSRRRWGHLRVPQLRNNTDVLLL